MYYDLALPAEKCDAELATVYPPQRLCQSRRR